ncbi:nuclear transport factor 2 family protein [Bradyrhizobium uaiense]|uniref:Nuclear transport factor 2 family protein n=1 Tax=Bradyrhizobium uaiense TaxID=2594946 RepID=A0A6P1BTZ6_9BRAD|nr:nuclear transport factor 2 family protein [Bradyrhizobium uaiense]NEV01977.1 nuclear transport factor 2 family protein [Bradyrhizobium uaiense]
MADREAMQRLVTQAYAARGKGEIDSLMETFGSDSRFELVGDKKALHLTGVVEGHANVRQALAQYIAAFEFMDRKITSFLVDGDRAAVHSTITVRFIPKNITFTADVLDLFRFENGKIAELVEFTDTALLKQVTSP